MTSVFTVHITGHPRHRNGRRRSRYETIGKRRHICARTGKRSYRSKAQADEALVAARRSRVFAEFLGAPSAARSECRVYQCPACGLWHLTSLETWS